MATTKTVYPSDRFSVLMAFAIGFLVFSLLLRLGLMIWQYDEIALGITDILFTLLTGLFYDIGTLGYLLLPALIYYFIWPDRWVGTAADKIIVWLFTSLAILLVVITFFAEITFWEEFRTRFNFIAVDYLIYTHEVVANIRQSYPMPLLLTIVFLITVCLLLLLQKRSFFRKTFTAGTSRREKTVLLSVGIVITLLFTLFIPNSMAEWSQNRYNSEIAKSGIYSFFAAFRNNQMEYTEFYTSIDRHKAFAIVREKVKSSHSSFLADGNSIRRNIVSANPGAEGRKNVVFILVESLSAKFMAEYGNKEGITPFLDSIAQHSISFTNLYATGTRTVRGMEAVTLCIPPTPGQSIVKRPDNQNLFTINTVFQSKKYVSSFFYGGDGYFDNMNAYFGGNGFTIYDRGHGALLSDRIKARRYQISDAEVSFENAWGICDEDILTKMIAVADSQYSRNELFFNFVMTTSNHRPYTYPLAKVAIPPGKNRQGAVQYTDYALRQMFAKAKTKPWYNNTVFVIIADHCASSAGKDEIDIANYHIPAFIINLPQQLNQKVDRQCSQIDIFPTLFNLLGWNYTSNFFGDDALNPDFEERAFVGTYRKLAVLKKDRAIVLSDHKKQAAYRWNASDNSLLAQPVDRGFLEEAIAWYQTADYLYTQRLLR